MRSAKMKQFATEKTTFFDLNVFHLGSPFSNFPLVTLRNSRCVTEWRDKPRLGISTKVESKFILCPLNNQGG
jgi:hypothetical protein